MFHEMDFAYLKKGQMGGNGRQMYFLIFPTVQPTQIAGYPDGAYGAYEVTKEGIEEAFADTEDHRRNLTTKERYEYCKHKGISLAELRQEEIVVGLPITEEITRVINDLTVEDS